MKYLYTLATCLFTIVSLGQTPRQEVIDAKNRKAYDLLRKSHRESAYEIAQETYELSEEIQYDKGLLWAKLISSNYLFYTNRIDSAQYVLESCLDGSYETAPIEEFGIAYWYLARIYRRKQEFGQAKQLYDQALEKIKEIDKPYLQGSILNDVGVLHGMQGEFSEALDFFVQGYQVMESAGLEFQDYTSTLSNIAMVYSRMGEYDQALDYLRPILEDNLQRQDTMSIGKSYNAIGGVYNYQLKYDSALAYYRLATQWARLATDIKSESIGLLNQAEMLFVSGHYQATLDRLKTALELVKEPYTISPTENIFRLMGKTYKELGQPDSARSYYWASMHMASSAGLKKTLVDVYESLYDLYREEQRSDSALYYFELHQAYKDSIYGEESDNKYSDLRVQLETLEQQKEIALLEADKKVNELRSKNLLMASLCAGLMATTIIIILVYRRKRQQQRIILLEAEMEQAKDQLTRQTLHMIHMNNGLDQVEQDIRSLDRVDDSGRVSKVISKINVNKALDKEWENFTTYFNRVNTGFFDELTSTTKDLSNHELRMCALLKLRLSNHEIATILNIETKSVRMAKYRLKKKLQLPENLDLNDYLQSIN